jgi:hypothetical protein
MIKQLTLEDIQEIVDIPSLSNQEVIDMVREELEINIDPKLDRKEMAEAIYDAYMIAITERVKEENFRREQTEKKVAKKMRKEAKGPSRKQFILDLITEGKYDRDKIIEMVNEEFNYNVQDGKSSRTRVSRTIRDLTKTGEIKTAADGTLSMVN